jgi:hypothetical protein
MRIVELLEIYSRNNIGLRNYLKNEEVDPYQYWDEFCVWVEEIADEYDEDDEDDHNSYIIKSVLQAFNVSNVSDLRDEKPDDATYASLPEDIRDEFKKWLIEYLMQHAPHEAPTWAHLGLNKLELLNRLTWLIHFTNKPEGIQTHGFTIGMDRMDWLGLTTYFRNDGIDKRHGGYNFAFIADTRYSRYAGQSHKYGKHAVMFQNSGVHTYHYGDEEDQVIFWGADVHPSSIVALYSDGDSWMVNEVSPYDRRSKQKWRGSLSNREGLFNGNFEQVEAWVMKNYRQYQHLITTGR